VKLLYNRYAIASELLRGAELLRGGIGAESLRSRCEIASPTLSLLRNCCKIASQSLRNRFGTAG
jgi:hypothetical protein